MYNYPIMSYFDISSSDFHLHLQVLHQLMLLLQMKSFPNATVPDLSILMLIAAVGIETVASGSDP